MEVKNIKTFYAGEDLEPKRLVKIDSSTTMDPPEVVYADKGDDAIGVTEYGASSGELIAVRLLNDAGTFEIECVVDSAIDRGTELYTADDGKVSDESSGSVVATAMETGEDGALIEVMPYERKATTAAGTSITDSGDFTDESTVEAALQEIYQHILTAQAFIGIPLVNLLEGDASNVVGYLKDDTTPKLDMADGDTDSGLVVTWGSGNTDPVLFQTPLPLDFDPDSDLVIHLRAKMSDSNDTPAIDADSYFNEGDTKVEDACSALDDSYADKTITIDASDIPSDARTLTVELTPGSHSSDDLLVSAIWIEYQRAVLTS